MQLLFDPWAEQQQASRLQEVAAAMKIDLELIQVRQVRHGSPTSRSFTLPEIVKALEEAK